MGQPVSLLTACSTDYYYVLFRTTLLSAVCDCFLYSSLLYINQLSLIKISLRVMCLSRFLCQLSSFSQNAHTCQFIFQFSIFELLGQFCYNLQTTINPLHGPGWWINGNEVEKTVRGVSVLLVRAETNSPRFEWETPLPYEVQYMSNHTSRNTKCIWGVSLYGLNLLGTKAPLTWINQQNEHG